MDVAAPLKHPIVTTDGPLPSPVLTRRDPPFIEDTEHQVGLAWLLRLRWGAVVGQLFVLAAANQIVHHDLPIVALLCLIALTAVTNATLGILSMGTSRNWLLPAVLSLDVLTLSAMLAISGGATNPFTIFYLVHVALAALLLTAPAAWSMVALTIAAYATLFVLPVRPMLAHVHHSLWSMHLIGMWVAYGLAATFVAYFIGKVSRAIRARDHRIGEVANLALQNERLASLSSFSANAAHELGSPLSTIGLAAKEIFTGLQLGKPTSALQADADLVCREVARCRQVLSDLSSRAGQTVGEMPVCSTLRNVTDTLKQTLSPELTRHLDVIYDDPSHANCSIVAPVRTLCQMLGNLIRNAFDAQEEVGACTPVELRIVVGEQLCFHVLDRGAGVPQSVQSHLGEPFVTTKGNLGGLGLGVYLARAYAERSSGHLLYRNRLGGGTDAELCLARNVLGEPQNGHE